jgi:hypothetical protein
MSKRVFRLLIPGAVIASIAIPYPGHSLSAESRPVGQLLNVAGRVDIQRAHHPPIVATLLFPLQTGDVLMVRDGGSAQVVLFQNGVRLTLPAGSTARVEPSALTSLSGPRPQPLPAVNRAFLRRVSTAPKQVSPRMLGILIRAPGDALLGPRNPAPNGAVHGAPVTLRWSGPIEGEQLRLQISDGERAIHRAELPATTREYAVPNGVLRAGEYYVWSVAALKGGDAGPRCRALVRMLLPQESADLEEIEREVAAARASSSEDPAPLLLLAQTYEHLGMLDDARATYEAVLRLRPKVAGVLAALKRLTARS